MKILIVSITDSGVLRARSELIISLIQHGHVVIVASQQSSSSTELEKLGCKFIPVQMEAHGINPMKELKLARSYKNIILRERPDVVLTFTIKPNIYVGNVCASLDIPYVANITGLGIAIENAGVLRFFTLLLYKYGLRNARKVFFQNTDNQQFMLKHGVVKGSYDLIPGSGVNLNNHCYEIYPPETDTYTFLYIGRMMKDKGIEELIHAAKKVKGKSSIRFLALGGCDENYRDVLLKIGLGEVIETLGFQKDVHSFIKQSHAVIMPSYHEGMSNVCLEAAACGRPVLASNIPGCRETFDEGVSGFGFKPKDVDSLCEAIEKFIALPYEEKAEMGRAGRRKMEREFDRTIVVDKYMEIVREIEGEKRVNLSETIE